MRTQTDIRARLDAIRAGHEGLPLDFAGWRQEALGEALDFEHVRDLLADGTTPDQWPDQDLAERARDYLLFAIGKALGHRGLSANRSVEKLEEWLWCLGDEDLADRFAAAGYAQYGAPKLQVLVEAWKVDHPRAGDLAWQRMARGQTCTDDCTWGCGR